MNAAERRLEIIDILCVERKSTTARLADYFRVSQRTILNDVSWLSLHYPILTREGRGGGITLADWYDPKKDYLTFKQTEILESIIPKHKGEEAELLKYILKKFGAKNRAC